MTSIEQFLKKRINKSFNKALKKIAVKGIKVLSQEKMKAGTYRDLTPEEEIERQKCLLLNPIRSSMGSY